MDVKWQKTSSLPSSGLMKPNPFSFQRSTSPESLPGGGGPLTPPLWLPPRGGSSHPPVTSSARSLPLRSSNFLTKKTSEPSLSLDGTRTKQHGEREEGRKQRKRAPRRVPTPSEHV